MKAAFVCVCVCVKRLLHVVNTRSAGGLRFTQTSGLMYFLYNNL